MRRTVERADMVALSFKRSGEGSDGLAEDVEVEVVREEGTALLGESPLGLVQVLR